MAVHQLSIAPGVTWKNITGSLWCDNKEAVKNYNELSNQLPFSVTKANELDADVLQELRH